jgi:hypothetical protein
MAVLKVANDEYILMMMVVVMIMMIIITIIMRISKRELLGYLT